MEWVETTAKTTQEAMSIALDRLGVDESDAEFEILDEGESKMFGLRRSDARVRARVRPTTPRPKTDRRSRKNRSGANAGRGDGGGNASRGRKRGGNAKKASQNERNATQSSATQGSTPSSDSPVSNGGQKSDPGRSDKAAAKQSDPPKTAAKKSDKSDKSKKESPMDDVTLAQQATMAEEFLTGLLDAFDLDGRCERVEGDEDTMEVNVVGEELGLLIGPRGQTLSALNELSRTVIQRQAAGADVQGRVYVDVASYRERRRAALGDFVRREAEGVLDDGRERSLEPMGAADRKTVHDAAGEIDGVGSRSEGDEPRRRVVLYRA